jgi:hypothetical protein
MTTSGTNLRPGIQSLANSLPDLAGRIYSPCRQARIRGRLHGDEDIGRGIAKREKLAHCP